MPRTVIGTVATIVAAVIVTVGGAGVAYAYWTAGGSGSSVAATGTTIAVTMSPAVPTPALAPGLSSNVVLTVSNPNTATVHINTLSLDTTQGTGGFAVDAAHSGCAVSALTFTTQSNGGSGWDVPGKVGGTNGSLSVSLPSALAMAPSASNACQGASFTVYVVAG